MEDGAMVFDRKKRIFLLLLVSLTIFHMQTCKKKDIYEGLPLYKNPKLSLEERVNDLISRMTLEEKVSQMVNNAASVERLGISEYNWWNECLHGVARAGLATVFSGSPLGARDGNIWGGSISDREDGS